MPTDEKTTFDLVLDAELRQIEGRRAQKQPARDQPSPVTADVAAQTALKKLIQERASARAQRWAELKEKLLPEQEGEKRPEQAETDAKQQAQAEKNLAEGVDRTATEQIARDAEGQRQQAVRRRANGMQLTGIAFSGGGIRSATVCLGILQGLADLGLLKRFDYLSTVSGGGYIGSWLAAWIKREGDVRDVEKQLRGTRVDQAKGRRPGASTDPGDSTAGGPPPPSNPSWQAVPVEEEPEPIFHLRSYSNYLAPRLGLNSADSWVLLSIYLRNFLLNQLVLLPAALAALLVPRMVLLFYDWEGDYPGKETLKFEAFWVLLAVLGIALLWACWSIVRCLLHLHRVESGHRPAKSAAPIQADLRSLQWRVLLPLLLAAGIAPWFAWMQPDDLFPGLLGTLADLEKSLLPPLIARPYLDVLLLFGGVFGLFFGLLHGISCFTLYARAEEKLRRACWWIVAGVFSGSAGGILLGVLYQFAHGRLHPDTAQTLAELAGQAHEVSLVTTLGPPGCLLVFVFGAILQIGLLGRYLNESEREWWASLCGWVLAYAAGWAVFCTLAFFAVPFLIWAGAVVQFVVGAGWVVTAVGGVLAGRSPSTGNGPLSRPLEFVAQTAPYVFVVGLLIGLAWVVSVCVDQRPDEQVVASWVKPKQTPAESPITVTAESRQVTTPGATTKSQSETKVQQHVEQLDEAAIQRARYWVGILHTNPKAGGEGDQPPDLPRTVLLEDRSILLFRWLAWLLGCVIITGVAAWHVSVNTFSLHGLYGNRLIRCYLGASRHKDERQTDQLHGAPANTCEIADPHGKLDRHPNSITGFDPMDDLPLNELQIGYSAPAPSQNSEPVPPLPYWGPYLLVNTALNLEQGDELAWQERKAEAFVLSPLYCGSKSTGYRDSKGFADEISLGDAVTVSGAAVSPNMGYHSSPAVAALLTFFNVRLGAWFGNPGQASWKQAEPNSLWLLFKELLGRTNRRSKYVYLSDGGHFENLGVYELVRRQCRYIVACDGGEDSGYEFYDLGSLIRKCRSDLGVPIEIDVTPIKPYGVDAYSHWHCVVGRIRYDALDSHAEPGLLLYIKASLTGDEPADVLNYAVENAPFPHQSTANQFFTESQFESYRALGHHVARQVFGEALNDVDLAADMTDDIHRGVIDHLFSNLRSRWSLRKPEKYHGDCSQ